MRQISDHCAVFLSPFITKPPLDTTILSTSPARNNCSPGFLEHVGMCFSMTHFSLCIIQESSQVRTCPKRCLLPQSVFPPYFITWSCHDKLENLHLCCDSFPAGSITTAEQLDFSYFPPLPQCSPAGTLQDLALWTLLLTGISCRV